MALVVGVLCAALLGIESTSSASGSGDKSGAGTVQVIVAPGLSLLGFLVGAPFGGLIGAVWSHKGLAGALGSVLVTLTGGFTGLTAAALLGAQTRVAVSANRVAVEHGAPIPVLVVGAALGLILGGLGAWWVDYRRLVGPGRQIQTEPLSWPTALNKNEPPGTA
jgi:hypothetical protein